MVSKQDIVRSLYNFSQVLVFPIEREFQPHRAIQFAADNWPLCFACVMGYVIAVFGGKAFMEKRDPFDLKGPLAVWNGFLSLFSFLGMCRTVSYFADFFLPNPPNCVYFLPLDSSHG
jgi:hypothetical protein